MNLYLLLIHDTTLFYGMCLSCFALITTYYATKIYIQTIIETKKLKQRLQFMQATLSQSELKKEEPLYDSVKTLAEQTQKIKESVYAIRVATLSLNKN